jgi:hypothetical protein
MPSVFDTLVDLTLGAASPIAPVTPPMFAPDAAGGATPTDVTIEVDAPSPARRRRRAPEDPAVPTDARGRERDRDADRDERDSARAGGREAAAPAPIVHAALPRPLVTIVHRTAPAAAADGSAAAAAPAGDRTPTVMLAGGAVHVPATADAAAPATATQAASAATTRAMTTRRGSDQPGAAAAKLSENRTSSADRDRGSDRREPSGDRVIRVTIGRVDVRAAPPREAARAPASAPTAPRAAPALGDYLRDRGGARGPR